RGREARCLLAGAGAVVERAGGGEADGAGGHGAVRQGGHGGDVVVGGRLPGHGPGTHGVDPEGAVGDIGGAVDVAPAALEGVEILGEAGPVPRQALVERRAGDVLHALHEGHEAIPVGGADGSEADAAVAEHDGGDALSRGREQVLVPRRLPVVVGVDVDPAGGDEGAGGVDLLPAPAGDGPDL